MSNGEIVSRREEKRRDRPLYYRKGKSAEITGYALKKRDFEGHLFKRTFLLFYCFHLTVFILLFLSYCFHYITAFTFYYITIFPILLILPILIVLIPYFFNCLIFYYLTVFTTLFILLFYLFYYLPT